MTFAEFLQAYEDVAFCETEAARYAGTTLAMRIATDEPETAKGEPR